MTREQMIFAVASQDVIDEIGEDNARAIFYYLLNMEKPSANALLSVANLANVLGRETAGEMFNELLSY